MFFIFGWGRTTQRIVQNVMVLLCANCHNVATWHALRRKTWFTFFFVPIIPYKTYSFLYCSVCNRGFVLSGDEFSKAERLSALRCDHVEKKVLTKENYEIAFNQVGLRDFRYDVKAISPPQADAGKDQVTG
jgi:hypothetical protein